jgi:hypothetical protein
MAAVQGDADAAMCCGYGDKSDSSIASKVQGDGDVTGISEVGWSIHPPIAAPSAVVLRMARFVADDAERKKKKKGGTYRARRWGQLCNMHTHARTHFAKTYRPNKAQSNVYAHTLPSGSIA